MFLAHAAFYAIASVLVALCCVSVGQRVLDPLLNPAWHDESEDRE